MTIVESITESSWVLLHGRVKVKKPSTQRCPRDSWKTIKPKTRKSTRVEAPDQSSRCVGVSLWQVLEGFLKAKMNTGGSLEKVYFFRLQELQQSFSSEQKQPKLVFYSDSFPEGYWASPGNWFIEMSRNPANWVIGELPLTLDESWDALYCPKFCRSRSHLPLMEFRLPVNIYWTEREESGLEGNINWGTKKPTVNHENAVLQTM